MTDLQRARACAATGSEAIALVETGGDRVLLLTQAVQQYRAAMDIAWGELRAARRAARKTTK